MIFLFGTDVPYIDMEAEFAIFTPDYDLHTLKELSSYELGHKDIPLDFPPIRLVAQNRDYLYDFLPYVGIGMIASEKLMRVLEGVNTNIKTHPVELLVLSTGEKISTYRLIIILDFLPIVNDRKSVFQLGREKVFSKVSHTESPLFRDKVRIDRIFVNQSLSDELAKSKITGYVLTPVPV